MVDVKELQRLIDNCDYTLYLTSKNKSLSFKVSDFFVNPYNLEFKNSNVCLCINLNNILKINFDYNNFNEYIQIQLLDGDFIRLIKRV